MATRVASARLDMNGAFNTSMHRNRRSLFFSSLCKPFKADKQLSISSPHAARAQSTCNDDGRVGGENHWTKARNDQKRRTHHLETRVTFPAKHVGLIQAWVAAVQTNDAGLPGAQFHANTCARQTWHFHEQYKTKKLTSHGMMNNFNWSDLRDVRLRRGPRPWGDFRGARRKLRGQLLHSCLLLYNGWYTPGHGVQKSTSLH
jgi:hypothetical protein